MNLESSWLNIEDKLALIGLYGVSSFFIYRPGRRQIGLAPHPDFVNVDNSNTGGQLFADEICYPVELGLQSLDPGQEIYDLAVLLQTGANHQETQSRARSGSARITFENPLFKAVRIAGRDGRTYLLLANFSGETVTLRSELPAEKGFDLAAGQSVAFKGMKVAPDSARLFRLD